MILSRTYFFFLLKMERILKYLPKLYLPYKYTLQHFFFCHIRTMNHQCTKSAKKIHQRIVPVKKLTMLGEILQFTNTES